MKKLTVGIRLLAVVILISALAACGGKAEKEETADNTDTGPVGPGDYFVDLNLGDDTYAGTADSPFLTITKAMSVAISGSTVTVRPGLYDALVETFPIVIPDGVDLLGDEPNKGAGGLGLDVRVHISDSTLDAVLAGSNSVVAGIRFTSYAADTGYSKSLLRVNTGSNTTFRNNTFDGHDPVTNGHGGLRTGTGALNITVTGNDFTGGLRYGLSL
ncbi:MAG: DUF1565 domain-containing protein, partial [Deltaproteobacteria bacterium]|nr:DUF1565 domain-containing protein [Deltaproteobacteria bacterium]